MGSLRVIKPGLLTSVQDLGRPGLAYYAIPPSGAMDKRAVRIAHLLLEQPETAPVLECTAVAPTLQFQSSARIVLSGADFHWTIDGQLIRRHEIIMVKEGAILKGTMAADGLRGYLAIAGHWQVENIYGSVSTYGNAALGGYQGRRLQKGDILEWDDIPGKGNNFPIYPGPAFDQLSTKAKQQLTHQAYTISPHSNRMGIRLAGTPLEDAIPRLNGSVPVLPGFIQLPPSGLPIIVLQDGQTTGGYPRIAYLKQRELSRLNQVPLGGLISFFWG